jgi:hypothetical protein
MVCEHIDYTVQKGRIMHGAHCAQIVKKNENIKKKKEEKRFNKKVAFSDL